MIDVAIIGATGYTGAELLSILSGHPDINVKYATSSTQAGRAVSDLFPELKDDCHINFSELKDIDLYECELVFFATPNGTAMNSTVDLLEQNVKVIDLAADFRIKDATLWEKWYGIKHACPDLLKEAIYGLPELNRKEIKRASLVANPGCYPTAIILGILPLVKNQIINVENIIADAKSGVSGAGREADIETENFRAYGVYKHRHLPEISQVLESITNTNVDVTFTPHLVPMIRGLLATNYLQLVTEESDLHSLYDQFYKNEPFVNFQNDYTPETQEVKGTNMCNIGLYSGSSIKGLIVMSVIDNLVKGAAGQAVQNMNIMLGFNEANGLEDMSKFV